MLPRWLIVCLGCLLLPVCAQAQYNYYFGRNKIQYEDFDWHILKTEHANQSRHLGIGINDDQDQALLLLGIVHSHQLTKA